MYATQLDLETAYGAGLIARLADNDGDGAADQAAIESALEVASAIIDGYLAVRYAVPLEQAPVTVRELCIDLALYRLAHNSLKQTAEMRLRYEDAIKFLERVADGKASIGIDVDGDGASEDQVADPMARIELLLRA